MCKSAINRFHHARVMRRRLRLNVWVWAKDNPKYRNMAARHSVLCSCWMCRSDAIAHKELLERRAMSAQENMRAWT